MNDINLQRLPGYDANGNPRYICHYTALLTSRENGNPELAGQWYKIAINRAHSIGGRRYRARWYGGGIVFQGYESNIKAYIREIVGKAEAEQAAEAEYQERENRMKIQFPEEEE